MKHTLYIAFRAIISIVAISTLVPATAAFASGGPSVSLADTSWTGTVTFISGPNNGMVETAAFRYHADHTLAETTDGPVGNYTGTGTWAQGSSVLKPCAQFLATAITSLGTVPQGPAFNLKGVTADNFFSNHFVEPIAGTNLEVMVDECGIISPSHTAYYSLDHGQLYSVIDGQATPIPGQDGYTISNMARQ